MQPLVPTRSLHPSYISAASIGVYGLSLPGRNNNGRSASELALLRLNGGRAVQAVGWLELESELESDQVTRLTPIREYPAGFKRRVQH